MVKARTEDTLRAALLERTQPLRDVDVDALCEAAKCSPATFYRSAAVTEFRMRLSGPAPKATKGTKENMTKLRDTVKLLANCVRVLSLRIERQEEDLVELRQRANSNVTAFPGPATRRSNSS